MVFIILIVKRLLLRAIIWIGLKLFSSWSLLQVRVKDIIIIVKGIVLKSFIQSRISSLIFIFFLSSCKSMCFCYSLVSLSCWLQWKWWWQRQIQGTCIEDVDDYDWYSFDLFSSKERKQIIRNASCSIEERGKCKSNPSSPLFFLLAFDCHARFLPWISFREVTRRRKQEQEGKKSRKSQRHGRWLMSDWL